MSKFEIEYVHQCVDCDFSYDCLTPDVQAYSDCACGCPNCEVNRELAEIVPSDDELLQYMADHEHFDA